MRCTLCRSVTRTIKSIELSADSQRHYHQCKNILCGHGFTTLETLGNAPKKRNRVQCLARSDNNAQRHNGHRAETA
ncbi:ogr/Delta-like zinc finger family protein [Yersinia bercovieri]|uniref:ogr/Delta-like zinc finger family protein n=1 Tax=Yersinia bercovieri TaxID=634 RepID=UPI0034E04863